MINRKTKREKRQDKLDQLFDNQIETLRSRNCPSALVKMLMKKRMTVLRKAARMRFPTKNLPFIPVIPQQFMNIHGLMTLVHHKGKAGFTGLHTNNDWNKRKACSIVRTPRTPYYMFDVKSDTLDPTRQIEIKRRSCLTEVEVIALAIHTNLLSRYSQVYALGCRCGRRKKLPILIPSLSVESDDWPEINTFWTHHPDELFSPSCRSRL